MGLLDFNLETKNVTGIKVIGVGGGGGNAVSRMYQLGIQDVELIICNTDKQALDRSPVPIKIQLGPSVCGGLGCGMDWEKGEQAAIESLTEIEELLKASKTDMLIITVGMGGGTGTGAAPVIAQCAKEMGILTIAIATTPFTHEGKPRMKNALQGIEKLKKFVDGTVIISNQKLLEIEGVDSMTMNECLLLVDDVLFKVAKGIAEIITKPGNINIDFADVKRALENAGTIYMSIGRASGENRAIKAVENALNSPLVENSSIKNAKVCVYNIIGNNVKMSEVAQIGTKIQEVVGEKCEIIQGWATDESYEDDLEIILIATGFPSDEKHELKEMQPKAIQDQISSSQPHPNTNLIQHTETEPSQYITAEPHAHVIAQSYISPEERIKRKERLGEANIWDIYIQRKVKDLPAYIRKKKVIHTTDNTIRISRRVIEEDHYGNLYFRDNSFYKDKPD